MRMRAVSAAVIAGYYRTGLILVIALRLLTGLSLVHADEPLMSPELTSPELFLEQAFDGKFPPSRLLVLPIDLRDAAQKVLEHPYNGMRVRYWWLKGRSAWIIDEIGKEKPITLGVVVGDSKIHSVQVLVYREERGGEVRLSSFLEQFLDARLNDDRHLDRRIDGITGATLSVNAVRKVAQLALVFHEHIQTQHP